VWLHQSEIMSELTVEQLGRRYGVKPSLVTTLVRAGVVAPMRGPHGAYLFGFQDIVLLRSAAALDTTRVKPKRLVQFLKQLRHKLPADAPLSSVRIALLGRELVVRIGEHLENSAGQLMLDFAVQSSSHNIEALPRPANDDAGDGEEPSEEAELAEMLSFAETLETERPAHAVRAYRQILQQYPECAEAAMNLIVLLLESGHAAGAHRVAKSAIALHPSHALLHFNLGVVCEELERFDEALLAYQIALQLDASLADAHFNAAHLYELRGESRDALRHMSAYRRLQRH
jgi:tetratricopeptide (TPR) repeat protein